MSKLLKNISPWAYFNGSTSYIEYADDDIFSFTDGVNDLPFEIEFDIILTPLGNFTYIVSKAGSTSTLEWVISTNSTKNIIFFISNGTALNRIQKTTVSSLTLNTPYRVKITYDASKTLAGMNIYLNNVLQSTTTNTFGTYTGMVNSNATFSIAKTYNNFFTGCYLRNLKIKKNNQIVFFTPLQDTNAVSADVIGGLVHNAGTLPVVVNQLESERWAYFNNIDSAIIIGDTLTLGWMNAGIWSMEFDLITKSFSSGKRPIYTAVNTTTRGFMLYSTGVYYNFYWCNGSGTYGLGATVSSSGLLGVPLRWKIKANGTQISISLINLSTNIEIYTSGWLNTTFVDVPTNTYALRFNYGYNQECLIKNFKIFTDTDGTIPFLSLPFQNPDAIAVDTVGGLIGTNTNVRLINNMENALVRNNTWSYFNGTSSYISNIGTKAQFDYIHQTGIFKFECDFIPTNLGVNYTPLFCNKTSSGSVGAGIEIDKWRHYIKVSVGNGTAAILNIYVAYFFTQVNVPYNIKVIGNGVTVYVYRNNVLFTQQNFTGAFGTTTSQYLPYIGRSQSQAYYLSGYLRNMKFWDNTGALIYHYTLQDNINIGADVISGLVGTPNNVTVVNQLENDKWSYFDKTIPSSLSIGTTSTFAWMNDGIFSFSFEIQLFALTSGGRPFATAYGPTNYGFFFYCNGSGLALYFAAGAGYIRTLIGSAITLGARYRMTVQGDGTNVRYIQFNMDTNTQVYDSGWVSCAFVSHSTTSYSLWIGALNGSLSYSTNCNMRNIKIFSDSNFTVPFLSLPMTNPDTVNLDLVGGLKGTPYMISTVNNNRNALKSCIKLLQFNASPYTYLNFGNTSTLDYMHSTGIFRFEFNIINKSTTSEYLFRTCTTPSQNGFYLYAVNGGIQFNMGNLANGYLIQQTIAFTNDELHNIKMWGDGSYFWYSIDNATPVSIMFNGSLKAASTTNILPTWSTNGASNFTGALSNFKIYNTSDTSGLLYHFPWMDLATVRKEIITDGLCGVGNMNYFTITEG